MADRHVVDCSTGETTTQPLTAGEETARVQMAADAEAARIALTQREERRQQAIQRLNAFVALGSGATAAQVRTEAQFVAKVLAKVLPFIDVDPA